MISKMISTFNKNKLWIISIIVLNIIFAVLLWISNDKAFVYIFPTMIIGSLIVYCSMMFVVYKRDLKREEAMISFLDEPSMSKEIEICRNFNNEEALIIKRIGEILRDNSDTIKSQTKGINEYEEYIEAWAHEIKTPLGLMTFVLANRKDEMPTIVYKRLEYARTKMQEDIERMLYYARLKSARSDYFFKKLSLKDICKDVIDEYKILLQEQGINVKVEVKDCEVFCDKKGVEFIIRQIISNSIKYKKANVSESYIMIKSEEDHKGIKLIIVDNGIGVKPYDLPFIFEKGFTGEIGEQRKNSTGMGLYLAKEVAHNLNVNLEVSEKYSGGFEISVVFPKVKN